MTSNSTIECLDCKHRSTYHPLSERCPECGSEWQQAKYDYDHLARSLPEKLLNRPFDMWRYHELLPLREQHHDLRMGEGGTPLIHARNLGMMLGCPHIYIKDERQGPTNSFKDRQAAIGIAALKEAGITEAVLASTGNVAIAYSAHAARAGIKLWAFLTSLVPAEKMREVAIYGTQVVKVSGSYDQAKQVAAEYAHQRGLYLERGARTVPSLEAMKTIAYEISEQITHLVAAGLLPQRQALQSRWQTPDWYFQAVSGGLGPLGVQKGFSELQTMGLVTKTPQFAIIQAEGCSPMVQAWQAGAETAKPIGNPRTHIATLATGDPGRTYTLLYHGIKETGGIFESVTDEEAFRTIHVLAKMEGISIEPASAVAFAGLIKLVRQGHIKPDEVIVINCTGHTLPVEKHILGDGWSRDVVFPSQSNVQTPREGLISALRQVSPERYPRIAIVDDTADARRLVRRVLQAQGDYEILEASDGQEGLDLIRKELPDLVILDLMMPEMDGFSVLDALKQNPSTAAIPVIVVTAKELSAQDQIRLEGKIQAFMQKGSFLNDDLLDEIQELIG